MKTYISSLVLVTVLGFVIIFSAGCDSDAKSGALIGTGAGAGIGAIIGNQSGHTGEGALIGGAAGAVGGYLIGNEGDKKKEQQRTAQATTYTPPPQQPQSYTSSAESYVTVPITNSNGSIIEVKLKKQGAVYIGPKGETYTQLPTSEQLKPIYGF